MFRRIDASKMQPVNFSLIEIVYISAIILHNVFYNELCFMVLNTNYTK